mmetsp:Transcript_37931/g.68558  ORF Transcript_37931/g.68558 Transcript_37931/m.68558 type:complete len:866 (-) Transcript_37931:205-2802(-)|eukprot:CAMPEP_0197631900 /NCGR_PEP_ID=MMETSP1338-20131121/8907_1 /TAXON_ID=43686 ORGANISM="Pelagodinium beii, Strain RCC1491" /NCGR_SAMPLE_ID=MMETSP1338 /ASSEMBLY_ACC=CAM_ASM_000754 /LENGTH=865 /DNA_ID=CAMNT_0043203441 /DNA_START=82 /DNA_END=2679 /DNA_ORIENTATION=+
MAIDGVCLGKCLPAGNGLLRKQYPVEAQEEIALLKAEIRELREKNEFLRQNAEDGVVHTVVRGRAATGNTSTTAPSQDDDADSDILDPKQVALMKSNGGKKPRVSVMMEVPDQDYMQEAEDSTNFDSGNLIDRTKSEAVLASNIASMKELVTAGMSDLSAKGSALGKTKPVQFGIYSAAFAFVTFVLIAHSVSYGSLAHALLPPIDDHGDDHGDGHGDDHGDGHGDDHGDGHGDDHGVASRPEDHEEESVSTLFSPDVSGGGYGGYRRLDRARQRRLGGGVSPLLQNIAFCLTSCGLVAFLVGMIKQPLILGYLLGGILVGPNFGLDLVHDAESVEEVSNLGLVFLLFMIGLELDVSELLKMGKVVLLTGALQFPICAGVQVLLFSALSSAGLPLGTGDYAPMYCGVVCGISSTMIVVKILAESGESERPNGRLTVGILIFQDIWAMVFLAVQPNLASPDIVALCKTFGMIILLIVISLAYAKFVMPAILFYASKSVELMLVLSLAWCFFMGCTATLPWIGIGMELAALIAGVALATFPYSAEFNGKIKYIRDFFITLFFAALGMKIPVPTFEPIATALVVSLFVLVFRWVGIYGLVCIFGGGPRLGALATINLSQISEFALVICSLGMKYEHVGNDTLTVIIWTFMFLAIGSCNLIPKKHQVYLFLARHANKMLGRPPAAVDDGGHEHHDEKDILLLGFHRIASMLVAEFEAKSPELLKKIQVVDVNESIKVGLNKRGIKFSYGDFSSADVLEHAFHGEPKIVLATTPDTMLQGTTNKEILKVCKEVYPNAKVIVTADNPHQAAMLYERGADYVLRSAKLCAERLHTLLSKFDKDAHVSELTVEFDKYKKKDKDKRSSFVMAKI